MTIRILIVDDSPLARKRLVQLIRERSEEIEIFEAGNGDDSIEIINSLNIDIMLLDVQMPGMDGFEVLRSIQNCRPPVVVFVTAFDQYAIAAFEAAAFDYILKPVATERFNAVIERALCRLGSEEPGLVLRKMNQLLSQVGRTPNYTSEFMVRTSKFLYYVPAIEVIFFKSTDNYVAIVTKTATHLIRSTISTIEAKVNPDDFIRIHRSYLVNKKFIEKLEPGFHGDLTLILRDGNRLPVSRRYRKNLPGLEKTDI